MNAELNSKFIPFEYLQEYFVDKSTGFPLSGGIVTFYKDNARTELKDVFQKTGSPPDYTYSAISNPIILSAVGTFQDSEGNDINVYGFPFDSNGNPELYYITVYSNDGFNNPAQLQFVRTGEPYIEQDLSDITADYENFVTNGQFLIHNYIAPQEIADEITYLTPDGWTYEKNAGSSSIDYVSFERFGSYTEIPSSSPRYDCRVRCTTGSTGDSFKALRLKFIGVNTFANTVQTFSFSAIAGSSMTVQINVIKNYGTNGDPQETLIIDNKIISTSREIFNCPIDFPDNADKTIGDQDDDYIQLEISLPANTIFDFRFTDIVLTPGDIILDSFKTTTANQFLMSSLAGSISIPDYKANDLYCPLVLTPNGLRFDKSRIGTIVLKTQSILDKGQLWADGSQYKYDEYSPDFIPYSRLGDYYWIWDPLFYANRFLFSSGYNFVTCNLPLYPAITSFGVTQNSNGVVTHPADGAIPTGLIFTIIQEGTALLPFVFNVTCSDPNLITEGSYWTFYDTLLNLYYVWYTKDDVGTDPEVPTARSGILVKLYSASLSIDSVIDSTYQAINRQYYCVPDVRGFFPRFWSNGQAGRDPDKSTRTSSSGVNVSGIGVLPGDNIGSWQLSQNYSHRHVSDYPRENVMFGRNTVYNIGSRNASSGIFPPGVEYNGYTNSDGGNEARSINMYIGGAIYY